MKRLLLLLFLPLNAFAQSSHFAESLSSDFPAISKEDLVDNVYEQDTTAAAVVLYDQGIISLDAYNSTTVRHYRRLKITKQSGTKHGNIMLFAYGGVQQVKAVTHNFDKTLDKVMTTPMSGDVIFKTKFNKWTDKISFTLPNVSKGSIIEITYVEKYPPATLPYWDFQYDIPVAYSECLLNSIGVKFNTFVRGQLPEPKHTAKYKSIYQQWVMRNVPALKSEPLMPNKKIFRSSISFTGATRSWGHVVADMGSDTYFWGVVNDSYPKKITTTVTDQLNTDEEKVKAICEYVKREIKWNGVYDHRGSLPKDVLDAKNGTSGDMNLLMASMLKNARINFAVVAVSTKEHGFIDQQFPSQGQFNHVMCLVFAKDTFLVDATDRYLPYKIVPAGCLNYDGLMMVDGGYTWITFTPVAKEKVAAQAKVTLREDGSLAGLLTITYEGYAAQDARKWFAELRKDAYIKQTEQDYFLDISESSFQDESLEKPFQETHSVIFEGKTNVNDGKIYLNPFLMFQEEENLFVEDSRVYPIDFGVEESTTFIGEITIPEGYVVDEMPTSKMFNLPGNSARYLLNCEFRQGKIVITSMLDRKKLIYPAHEYAALREFFARVVAKNSEMVVLRKAN